MYFLHVHVIYLNCRQNKKSAQKRKSTSEVPDLWNTPTKQPKTTNDADDSFVVQPRKRGRPRKKKSVAQESKGLDDSSCRYVHVCIYYILCMNLG